MNFLDLDRPEGGIYICTVLLLFLGMCLALPLHVIGQRRKRAAVDGDAPRMPWWGAIVLVVPHLAPLIPGSDKWIVPKGLAYPIIGAALLLGGLLGLMAVGGLIVSLVRLVAEWQ